MEKEGSAEFPLSLEGEKSSNFQSMNSIAETPSKLLQAFPLQY